MSFTYYDEKGGAHVDPLAQMVDVIVREDGLRVERICPHGVGHPIGTIRPITEQESRWVWVHGCDGCCEHFEG